MAVRALCFPSLTCVLILFLSSETSSGLKNVPPLSSDHRLSRRDAFRRTLGASVAIVFPSTTGSSPAAVAASSAPIDVDHYESRNRNGNKDALVREDIWYMAGKTPPRRLVPEMLVSDEGPKWNAWGTCATSASGGNSCTYVPLSQRVPGYSKYAFNVALGARQYAELGTAIDAIAATSTSDDDNDAWRRAERVLTPDPNSNSSSPPPAKDALLKMALLGTALLTTPNYSGPPKELMVARFYVNEVDFALNEVASALDVRDLRRAKAAWEFGRDSWNSYFVLVNRAIVPKVGDKFGLIV